MPKLRVKVDAEAPAPAVRVDVDKTASLGDARRLILDTLQIPIDPSFWLSLDKQVRTAFVPLVSHR